jgi:hypothetical protein
LEDSFAPNDDFPGETGHLEWDGDNGVLLLQEFASDESPCVVVHDAKGIWVGFCGLEEKRIRER